MGWDSKICLSDTAEINIEEQIRLSAPRGAEGWEPRCAELGPNTCGDPAGTPESPALTLGSSKHMQMCLDILLWAGWCGSVGPVRCVSAPRAGSWAAIVTFFFGEDSYEITYLAEMLSSDQSCFAALLSKSSFFALFTFPLSSPASFLSVTFPCGEHSKTKSTFSLCACAVFNVCSSQGCWQAGPAALWIKPQSWCGYKEEELQLGCIFILCGIWDDFWHYLCSFVTALHHVTVRGLAMGEIWRILKHFWVYSKASRSLEDVWGYREGCWFPWKLPLLG